MNSLAKGVGPTEDEKPIRRQNQQGEKLHPAAAILLYELFPINMMCQPKALTRCLCTTNLIESPHSGVRMRTRRVCHWQDGQMVRRWATAAFLETEKHFQKIGGHQQLWMLKSHLDELENEQMLVEKRKVG